MHNILILSYEAMAHVQFGWKLSLVNSRKLTFPNLGLVNAYRSNVELKVKLPHSPRKCLRILMCMMMHASRCVRITYGTYVRYCLDIVLKWLSVTTKHPGWDLNSGPSEYEAGVVTTRPRRSVVSNWHHYRCAARDISTARTRVFV
jgi:hypothetical protein